MFFGVFFLAGFHQISAARVNLSLQSCILLVLDWLHQAAADWSGPTLLLAEPRLLQERVARRGERQMRDPRRAERCGALRSHRGVRRTSPGTSFNDGDPDSDSGRCPERLQAGA